MGIGVSPDLLKLTGEESVFKCNVIVVNFEFITLVCKVVLGAKSTSIHGLPKKRSPVCWITKLLKHCFLVEALVPRFFGTSAQENPHDVSDRWIGSSQVRSSRDYG